MTNEIKQNDDTNLLSAFSAGIPNFILKTVIVVTAITLTASSMIPEMPWIPETERNKLILLSFIQNPDVLWKLSVMEQENGNVKAATSYMEAAIGLMEMNGASDKSLKKYQERLEKINSK